LTGYSAGYKIRKRAIRIAWQSRNIAGLAKYLKNIVMAGKIRKTVHCAPGNRKGKGIANQQLRESF
jgi:hypothetical protein